MSDFTVLRSINGYCLVLDNKRIAGGKPDYRGENVLVDWTTEVAYGPVADLAAENAKLRELVRDMHKALFSLNLDHCQACPREDTCVFTHECAFERDMRELGVGVDA